MKKMLMGLLLAIGLLMAKSIVEVQEQHKDYALIVAIGDYQSKELSQLNVYQDIEHYRNVLRNMNFSGKEMLLINGGATKDEILNYIKTVSKDIKDGDRFFMFFTGHGTDVNDVDFGSKLQETLPKKYWEDTGMILPWDFNPNKKRVANSMIIGKRDLRKHFEEIDRKTDKAFIVFDACFSENSSKGEDKSTNINKFLYIDTQNNTYPYKHIVYIGASKTQAKQGKLSKVLNDCIGKDSDLLQLKSCMNKELKKSPHRAVVLSMSDEPAIFRF